MSQLHTLLEHYPRETVVAVSRSLKEVVSAIKPANDIERAELKLVRGAALALDKFAQLLK